MKKAKRYLKEIINFFKGIRISTIYKIVGVFLLVAILFWAYKTLNKSEKIVEKGNTVITGTITNKGEDYIIVEDQNKKEYMIQGVNEEDYSLGSNVDASAQEVIENQQNTSAPATITGGSINVTNEKKETKNADEEIITYMNETDKFLDDVSFKEEAKTRFITIADFLFYNGSIKGYTLNDLTSKAKLTVMKIALSIDNKIENYFPGYKETISATTGKAYIGLKLKLTESYLTLTTKVCNYDKNLCDSAINDFQEMKAAFSLTWSLIKNLISTGTENLQDWYEIYSGKKN